MTTRILGIIITSLLMVCAVVTAKLGLDYINLGHGLTPYIAFPYALFSAGFAFKVLFACFDVTESE